MPGWIIFVFSTILMSLISDASVLRIPERNEPIQYAQLEKRDDSQSGFLIKMKAELVSMDAVIRNDKGKYIEDLQASDFEVYDDGIAQEIALFSHDYKPLDIALIVDASYSEQNYRSRLRSASLDVLQKLDPKQDRVALFCFGTYPIQLTGLTLDRSLVVQSMDRIPQLGASNISYALWDATQYLALQPKKDRRRAIILISDNFDSLYQSDKHSFEEAFKEMLESDIILISIKTPGEKSKFTSLTNIAQLAADTGGEVLDANSADDLSYALDAAVLRLKQSYVIGFYPSDERSQGSYHNLKVIFNKNKKCAGCKVWTRKGYYTGGESMATGDKKKNTPILKNAPISPNKTPVPSFGLNISGMRVTPEGLFFEELSTKNTKRKTKRMDNFDGQAMYPDPGSPGRKYVSETELYRLAASVESSLFPSNYVSRIYLAGIKKTWTDDKNPYIFYYLRYLIDKENENPQFNDVNKRLSFQIAANRLSESEDKQVIKIDMKCDANRLFFFFTDERYKSWLVLAFAYQNKSELFIRFYEPSYSEEEFRQKLQSGIPLSFTTEIPPAETKLNVIIFNPMMSIYGIQYLEIHR